MDIDTLIIGNTFLGMGYALQNPASCLIIEGSTCIGNDFIEVMNPGNYEELQEPNLILRRIIEEAQKRNIFRNGSLHLAALSPLMAKFLIDEKIKCYFSTHVLRIIAIDNGYEVEILNQNGVSKIYASKILDTTNLGYFEQYEIKESFINAVLHHDNDLNYGALPASIKIFRGFFSTESFLSISLSTTSTIPEARKILHNFWVDRPQELQEATLASVASKLDMTSKISFQNNDFYFFIPSRQYIHPFISLNEGSQLQLTEGVAI